jgi:hypothetical protein
MYYIKTMNSTSDKGKADRFQRLAERRVTEVVKKMRLIANLANKRNYTYTDEHVKQILDALEAEVRLVKAKFRQETAGQSHAFSFRK